jgi:hypothetical protein
MKTSFICISVTALILATAGCSTRHQKPKGPQPDAVWWAPGENWSSKTLTRIAFDQSLRSGDVDVASAAEYNQLHVVLTEEDDAMANAALQALGTIGDDYTIAWLESLEGRRELAHRQERFAATRARIQERLLRQPLAPAQQVQARFLRAGVARLCNPLELTLPAFTSRWARDHLHAPGVQAELSRFRNANRSEETRSRSLDRSVRDLAARLADGLPRWQPMFH